MKFQREMLTLYAVTDRTWLNGRTLAEVVEQAIRGGATMVQLREKDKTPDEILASAREILPVCHKYGVPFIMNDSIELARAAGADGVHLGQSDVPGDNVRALADTRSRVLSANTVESAQRAQVLGADYLGVGAVFGTTTKHDARHLSPKSCARSPGRSRSRSWPSAASALATFWSLQAAVCRAQRWFRPSLPRQTPNRPRATCALRPNRSDKEDDP